MRKVWLLMGMIGVLAIVGLGLSMYARASEPTTSEHFAFGHPGAGSGPVQVIHIRALDTLRFQPAHVTVARGATVKFVIANTGKLLHEFVIGDAKVQAAHEQQMHVMPGMVMPPDVNAVTLPPGQTRELVWTFTRAGTVEYACHVPGHFAAGMVGKISIEPPARR